MKLRSFFFQLCHSVIVRCAAVTLLALAWTGFAFCAPGQISSRNIHSKCGDWDDDSSKTVADCVLRNLLSYKYRIPNNQSEAEKWARHHGPQYKVRHAPIPYKELVSSDQDGYTFRLRHLIVDSYSNPYASRQGRGYVSFHFDQGEQIHVAFADVTGVKTTGGTQLGGSDIHLLSATGELDEIWVSRGERRDALLALHTLCPNAKFAGKYSK